MILLPVSSMIVTLIALIDPEVKKVYWGVKLHLEIDETVTVVYILNFLTHESGGRLKPMSESIILFMLVQCCHSGQKLELFRNLISGLTVLM